ncbi:MAG: DUF2807 domain-containing protein [Flavobacterium sp.]|nr:DUF2807 domain-containing protein [Flavobacterium sp.]
MTKLIITFTKAVIAFVLAVVFSSCNFSANFGNGVKGSGNITTITRAVTADFKSIEVRNGINVIVSQSDSEAISVTADDNLIPLIRTEIQDGVLLISSFESYNSRETPLVRVAMPSIESLVVTGGSHLESSGVFISEDLTIKSASGSTLELTVEAEKLSIETAGGSSAEIKGKAIHLETSSASGSTLDAGSLQANYVTTESSSGSSTVIHPLITLSAKATSGSSINYVNVPKTFKKESSSGGSISKR